MGHPFVDAMLGYVGSYDFGVVYGAMPQSATPSSRGERDSCRVDPACSGSRARTGLNACLEHLSAILAQENPSLRVYWVDPGDMRTQMQQDAFPDEDISDRPLPEESVPGLLALLEGKQPSGRYKARELAQPESD